MPRFIVYLMFVVLLSIPVSGWSVTFKIATVAPEGSQWMQKMRVAAIVIKERTDGRVQLKFYGGGVMGNEKSVLRKMRMGQLHGSAFTGGGLGKINPDVLLYGLPLLTRSAEEMTYLRQQMDQVFINKLGESGFISFGFAGGGFANLMSQTPIEGIADMKGLKVWVPEGDRVSYAVMEALGLAPVTLPLSDVLTGLQTGLVEVVGTSPLGALAFQWYTRVSYITPMPLAYIYGSLVIDKRRFGRISPADQGVMRDVFGAMYRDFDKQNALDNSGALHALQGEGLKIIQPKNGEYDHWEVVAGKVVHDKVKQGLFSAELYEQIQEHLRHYRNNIQSSAQQN